MGILPSIGISKSYHKDKIIDAAQNAIENYKKDNIISQPTSIIVIIKSYGERRLVKLNEMMDLVQNQLGCDEISCIFKKMDEEDINDKVEVILIVE